MDAAIKTPKYEQKIHLPEVPGSFSFRKNGKVRLDQQVKKFCLLNECRGCFEVKVHFGRHVNPKNIKYDAANDGIHIDTLADQQKFKLFVPYPKGLTLSITEHAQEAQWFCGKLSAKVPIASFDKSEIMKTVSKRAVKTQSKVAAKKQTATIKATGADAASAEADQEANDADGENTVKKTSLESASKKKSGSQRAKRQKPKKTTLQQLNKRIANNVSSVEDGEPSPKKRKLNKKKEKAEKAQQAEQRSLDAQHALIDGVVDRLEDKVREKRRNEVEKDLDIKEYLQGRADKKKQKQMKKEELRLKFLDRRNAKKKVSMAENAPVRMTGKKVKFAV